MKQIAKAIAKAGTAAILGYEIHDVIHDEKPIYQSVPKIEEHNHAQELIYVFVVVVLIFMIAVMFKLFGRKNEQSNQIEL